MEALVCAFCPERAHPAYRLVGVLRKEGIMAYDSSLDQKVFSKSLDTGNGKITVSVYSYNKGPNKLQISREIKGKDGNLTFAKLGRLSKEELEGILPIIQEALEAM